ncbi:hypothetical protein L541_1415 [Bordetella hinzii CA90 BAL1384]|nr:hypothetical protein L541_1415 [Bordetella hinzii CA90 BAL1384]KCB51188.1 hypothetical protein L537_1416 [Bordetella hinzii 1277]
MPADARPRHVADRPGLHMPGHRLARRFPIHHRRALGGPMTG